MVEPTPSGEAKANVTDPDSRVMKTRQGYVQGYNVQAVVSEDQIIVAVGVTQEANDVHQLLPMLEDYRGTGFKSKRKEFDSPKRFWEPYADYNGRASY